MFYIIPVSPSRKSKEMVKSRKLFLPLRYAMMFAVPGWKNEQKPKVL